jgi:hypothetical protein
MVTVAEVRRKFEEEFSGLLDKFQLYDLACKEAEQSKEEGVTKPGVYVWWNSQYGLIKVGRSLKDSRKRAFEHFPSNTKGAPKGESVYQMRDLSGDLTARLLLFNIKRHENSHWVLAAEDFLERELKPYIRSERRG